MEARPSFSRRSAWFRAVSGVYQVVYFRELRASESSGTDADNLYYQGSMTYCGSGCLVSRSYSIIVTITGTARLRTSAAVDPADAQVVKDKRPWC